jgi:glutaredoxin 3
MSIVVYSQPGCPSCVKAKDLLNSKSMVYTEIVIGEHVTREHFKATFPHARTVPYIMVDGMPIGGYEKLTEWLNRPSGQFLTE